MQSTTFRTVAELSRALAAREVSAVELAQDYLARIEAHKELNCFLDVRPEVTLEQAREADKRIAEGTATRLTGIPIAHKDIFVTRKWASTAASRMFEGYMSPFDAAVVKKLDAAGMVTLGKLNCDEFAMGSANENSAYGKVFNPWNVNAVPGGSSGGSSGSSSGKTTYKVTTSAVNNGGVNASPSNAEKGATIILTLSPDKGYKLDKLTVTDGSGKSVSTVKKSDTVYTFTMPASAVKVGVSYVKATETPSETKFNDVSANDWFASAVDYVTGKGMMNGTAANTFSPKANTTRGMLMTVLARHAGEDTTGGSVWYEKGMNWAKANGVSDGTNPQVNITREQLAAMLYRYAQNKKYDVSGAKSLDGYTDAQSVSSYAVPALQWANAAGVVNGKSGSKLDPKGYATRAEVAAMLMRFCENVEK